MSKKLTLTRDTEAIKGAMDVAYGTIGNRLDIETVKKELTSIYQKSGMTKKVLKGSSITIVAYESLPKAYRYSKDVGKVTFTHDGKDFVFVAAGRATCWAGSSVGGTRISLRHDTRAEVISAILSARGISFMPAPAVIQA